MSELTLKLALDAHLLVLIGGGEFSFGETREIDEFLVARMPADNRTVAFIPAASGSAEYAGHLAKYLLTFDPGIEVRNVPIYRGRDNRRQKNLDAIRSAGMIYIGGGVTNNLLGVLRASPAEEAMKEAAAGGALVAAIGAGAASFGLHARDMRGVSSAIDGLGWVEGAVIETGFAPDNDESLRRLMSLPDVTIGLGIPSGTAIAIGRTGGTEIVGPAQVATYRKR